MIPQNWKHWQAAPFRSVMELKREDMQSQILNEALQNFPLEQLGGRYTFLHRLCRENGWSKAEGQRAIGEYKRFVYLASVSPAPVTPPPAVDQVWHLHLLYTRSYWDGLCQGILGRPLHHGPTAGGEEEDAKFGDWYERTRELYRKEFGDSPPAGIWPARFSAEKQLRWADMARNWVIPKPSFAGILPGVFPALLLGSGVFPLLLIGVVALVIWVIQKMIEADQPDPKRRAEGGDSGGSGSFFDGGSDCGDSGGGDCGGGDGGGGCGGGGCGGGD